MVALRVECVKAFGATQRRSARPSGCASLDAAREPAHCGSASLDAEGLAAE
jgi:hypothetical protein